MFKLSLPFFTLFAFLFSAGCIGQQPPIDSLKRSLATTKQAEKRVIILARLGYHYAQNKRLDSCFWFSNAALQSAQKIGFKGGEAEAWYALGRCYRAEGNYQSHITCCRKALAIGEQFNYVGVTENESNFRIQVLNNLSGVYDHTNADSALYFRGKFNNACQALNLPKAKIRGIASLGAGYFETGDYVHALKLYYEALYLAEKTDDRALISMVNRNIGQLYVWVDEDRKAKLFLLKALALTPTGNAAATQRFICGLLSEAYEGTNKLDSALYYGEKAYQLGIVEKDTREMGYFIYTCAKAHERLGHTKLALHLYKQSLEAGFRQNNPRTLSYVEQELAKLYAKLGKIDSCIYFAQQSYKIGKAIGFNPGALKAGTILTQAYKAKNNVDSAFKYQEITLAIKEKLMGQQQVEQLQLIHFEEQRRQEQAGIALEKRQNQLKTGGLLGLIIIVALIAFIILRNRTLTKQNAALQTALLEGQATERKRVAADLHDALGSTLSSLRWSMGAIDKNKLNMQEQEVYQHVQNSLEQAYDQVRLLSHNLLPEELKKQGLWKALEVLVRKLNRNTPIMFTLQIPENQPCLNAKTEFELYSICLELINNILKHAQATEASVKVEVKSEKLQLTVTDNGKGISENTTAGKGLRNIAERVESLKGKWEKISDDLPGTKNVITLSLEKSAKPAHA